MLRGITAADAELKRDKKKTRFCALTEDIRAIIKVAKALGCTKFVEDLERFSLAACGINAMGAPMGTAAYTQSWINSRLLALDRAIKPYNELCASTPAASLLSNLNLGTN